MKLGWLDIEWAVNELAKMINEKKFKYIYGIPRGGLIPAVMLSHKLSIPMLKNLADSALGGAKPEEVLIVDDISDTGNTLLQYNGLGYSIATIHYHKQSKVLPDYYVYIKEDEWIDYPWEVGDE